MNERKEIIAIKRNMTSIERTINLLSRRIVQLEDQVDKVGRAVLNIEAYLSEGGDIVDDKINKKSTERHTYEAPNS